MKIGNINIIVAVSENNVIGVENDLPWHLPKDMQHFKDLTIGYPVVMGRKTYESLPEKVRPLPKRPHVLITRNEEYDAGVKFIDREDCIINTNLVSGLEEFIYNYDEIFVIGGAQIYKDSFQYANKVYLTRVHKEVEGDTYLEGFDPDEWDLVSTETHTNDEDGTTFSFEEYGRKVVKPTQAKTHTEIKLNIVTQIGSETPTLLIERVDYDHDKHDTKMRMCTKPMSSLTRVEKSHLDNILSMTLGLTDEVHNDDDDGNLDSVNLTDIPFDEWDNYLG
jgi:dihydrofolate reductase